MEFIYELEFKLNRNIPSKKRPRFKKTGVSYNPSKQDELELLFDLTNLLSEDDIEFIKTIKNDTKAIIEVYVRNEYKTKSKNKHKTPKLTVPDIDNFLKLFMDAVNGEFWPDDRQVYKATSEKFYNETDRAYIKIKYYR